MQIISHNSLHHSIITNLISYTIINLNFIQINLLLTLFLVFKFYQIKLKTLLQKIYNIYTNFIIHNISQILYKLITSIFKSLSNSLFIPNINLYI